MKNKQLYKERKNSLLLRLRRKLYYLFRVNDSPTIKLYRGFGNLEKVIVLGHTFKRTPMPRKKFRQNWFVNSFSMLRLFLSKPLPDVEFSIQYGDETFYGRSAQDGFIRMEISPQSKLNAGWHKISGQLAGEYDGDQNIPAHSEIYIPFSVQHGFISDIDDTFLISHSGTLRKRLFALLTKNERTRKSFEGVVQHYQQLASSNRLKGNTNPFFYVSSSEWNLYDFVRTFAEMNHLPKGVFLLGQHKRLKSFWSSGQNNHKTKFFRIVRIIESYRHLKLVLLGDDSQQDAFIYYSIAEHFPGRIIAVYLRHLGKERPAEVISEMEKIKALGVDCCYFDHSSEAIRHSKEIGLL